MKPLLCVLTLATLAAFIGAGGEPWFTQREALKPINPPKPAETKEELATIKALLEKGEIQRRERLIVVRRLASIPSRYRGSGEVTRRELVYLTRAKDKFLPSINAELPTQGEVGVLRSRYNKSILEGVEVLQVVDADSMLVECRDEKFTFWLDGFSTAGLADGDRIAGLASLLEVTGTKQYGTAIGSTKTVMVLEPFGIDPNIFDKEVEVEHIDEKEEPVSRDPRTWTDKSGKFSVEAVFVSLVADTVKLKKSDGTIMTVSLGRLSKEDQEWIDALR